MNNGQLLPNPEALRATVVVRNPQGLHMRPAMMIAKIATKYRSTVTVRKQDRAANAKSLLNLMSLAALSGTELILEVVGDDAETALAVLCEAISARSPEDLEHFLK